MHSVIIADTSCLIVLSKLGRLELLNSLYKNITITSEIQTEFGQSLPDWISIQNPSTLKFNKIIELNLDKGEASAIALCLESPDHLLIIDERKGRVIAKDLNLNITGTIGVLLKCKQRGLITSLLDVIDEMEENDFRISLKLKKAVLKLVNE